MKRILALRKAVTTHVNRVFTNKSFNNSLVLLEKLKKKNYSYEQAGVLRLQNLNTSTCASTNDRKHFLKDKVNEVVIWYEEFTGLDEVKRMQNRVIEAQNRLVQAQESRREATKSLVSVQNKLKDVRAELDTTSKGEERYLYLITQEHSILKEEKSLLLKFQLCEKEERDCFAFLSAAVKESHEKERAQAERTKYWSIIGSVIGTIIGVLGSSINNEFKMKELRKLVKLSADNHSLRSLELYEKEIVSLVNEIKSLNQKKAEAGGDEILNGEVVLHYLNNYPQDITIIEKILEKQRQEIKNAINLVTVVAVTVAIVCVLIQRLS